MEIKKLLPNVPAIWYGHPSAVCYIGSVMRLMEYIGDPVEEDELFALSGAGLCFPWRFASSCDEVSIIPEIPARTFGAFGYESEHLTGDAVSDKAMCFGKIKESIDRGMPVIGFGITTAMPMTCLIVGYDENGLYTRACWQPNGESHDSEEYFYLTEWHENCSGLLIVGEKTGERLTGKAAYAKIAEWALIFRCYGKSVLAEGQDIYINKHAYEAMYDWLLDDTQWQNPNSGGREQFLKQCGLLLLGYYRGNLRQYLEKLDAQYPGVVNAPLFDVINRISDALPGANTSDLWLHEAVDPALSDFSKMTDRDLRKKVVDFVHLLCEYDNSVQWTLFMPDFVKNQTKGFKVDSFDYLQFPAMRFIGVEGKEFDDIGRRVNAMKGLDEMTEFKSDFDHDIFFNHHYGLSVDNQWHGVWGRFMKADTPVPDGYISFDFAPYEVLKKDLRSAGVPFYSRFALAKFSGDVNAMHSREGFDSDAMYDVTRNIILGNGVEIPYPEKYWTAEVFLNGCNEYSTGFLFSVGDWQTMKK